MTSLFRGDIRVLRVIDFVEVLGARTLEIIGFNYVKKRSVVTKNIGFVRLILHVVI